MLSTFAADPDLQSILWALLTPERNEVSFLVLIGLAIIAIVWIAAGLYMMRSSDTRRRVR